MDSRYLFHIRERSSWPRISKLRHKCLLSQLTQLSAPHIAEHYSSRIVVRLQPYERIMLEQTFSYLALHSGISPPKEAEYAAVVLFFRWAWADNVLRQVLTELDPEWVEECYDGKYDAAIEAFKTQLRTRVKGKDDLYDRRHYRTLQLLQDNPALCRGGNFSVTSVTAVLHPDDMELWRILGAWALRNYGKLKSWQGFRSEVADLLAYQDLRGEAFTTALCEAVAKKEEETPDFPPRSALSVEPRDGDEDGVSEDNVQGGEDEDGQSKEDDGADEVLAPADADELVQLMSAQGKGSRVMNWANATAQLILEAEDLWDVWSLCRMMWASSQNSSMIRELDSFVISEPFSMVWKRQDASETSHQIVAVEPVSDLMSKRKSEIMPQLFQEGSEEFLETAFYKASHEQPIPHPHDYLRFVPWSCLDPVEFSDVSNTAADLGLDASKLEGSLCLLHADKLALLGHTLYLSDDLFPPHVVTPYGYPGYFLRDSIILRRRAVTETEFISQIRYFWELWNDSALTRDPSTGSFFLLETLPGVKARMLESRSGIWSAFDFFDHKYRYRESLSQQRESLQQLLGPKYDPSYSDFLVLIDAGEINLAHLKPIGRGSFGQVYKARWDRKPRMVADHTEEESGFVALKVALGDTSWDEKANFFEELATVYSALAGDSSGCVPFYGFCKVFIDSSGKILDIPARPSPEVAVSAKETFALVFDFASGGAIMNFLDARLTQGNVLENWLVICGALSSLATGLMTIHRKDIVHLDLHPGNVLIQEVHTPSDDEVEFDCLLSDLGEGKDISRTSKSSCSGDAHAPQFRFSPSDFIAPSQKESPKAADIYAWGQLGVRIIRIYYTMFEDEDGKTLFPAALMRVIENCIGQDPRSRLDATSLVVAMDEVMDGPSGLAADAYGNKVMWYDGSYKLPNLDAKLSADLELGKDWLKLTTGSS